jgi:hypothetical protein
VAAQDKAVSTNYLKTVVLKEEIDSKCPLHEQHEVPIDHLTSGCPVLAKNEYLMRQDIVAAHLTLLYMQSIRYRKDRKMTHTHTHHTHTHTHIQASMWKWKCDWIKGYTQIKQLSQIGQV